MTWTDRIALLRIFLAWLFGSILFGYTVDKFGRSAMTNIILVIITAVMLVGGTAWIERIGRGDAE